MRFALPHDLAAMTQQQCCEVVDYLAMNKTVSELRRDQEIVFAQMRSPHITLKATTNLQIMDRTLAAAIDRRVFDLELE